MEQKSRRLANKEQTKDSLKRALEKLIAFVDEGKMDSLIVGRAGPDNDEQWDTAFIGNPERLDQVFMMIADAREMRKEKYPRRQCGHLHHDLCDEHPRVLAMALALVCIGLEAKAEEQGQLEVTADSVCAAFLEQAREHLNKEIQDELEDEELSKDEEPNELKPPRGTHFH